MLITLLKPVSCLKAHRNGKVDSKLADLGLCLFCGQTTSHSVKQIKIVLSASAPFKQTEFSF